MRALHWPAGNALFVADTHFGKAETFRASGIPVPTSAIHSTLQRLSDALQATSAGRLIILGDFWHSAAGATPSVVEAVSAWRMQYGELAVDVVLGNHDRFSHEMPAEWKFQVHREPLAISPFVAAHYPNPHGDGYVLAGHLHPGYTLRGRARQSVTLSCFWFGRSVGVLPAIGEFTGLAPVSPLPGDRVFLVADDEVTEAPGL